MLFLVGSAEIRLQEYSEGLAFPMSLSLSLPRFLEQRSISCVRLMALIRVAELNLLSYLLPSHSALSGFSEDTRRFWLGSRVSCAEV